MSDTPQNLDAEEYVLGASMMSPNAADKAVVHLRPEHFYYRERHGFVFEAISSLRSEGIVSDCVAVIGRLEVQGRLEAIGGAQRVTELYGLTPAASNVLHYAELVRDSWAKRELVKALMGAQREALNGSTATDALAGIEDSLQDLRSKMETGRSSVMTEKMLTESFEAKVANPPDLNAGVQTPFRLPNMQPGRLYVLAGYPADGKTALAVQFLRSAATGGANVGFVSIEMSKTDLADRIVSSYDIPYHDCLTGRIQPQDEGAYRQAMEDIRSIKFSVIDDEASTSGSIRRHAKVGRYDALIIDHLHRIDWAERRDLERMIRGFVNLAREQSIPVLLLAQLRRHGDEYPRPSLASVRETGMTEAEAAAMWFVWRKRDEEKLPTTEAEFIIAKNRFGPTGKFDLFFDAEKVRFTEVMK